MRAEERLTAALTEWPVLAAQAGLPGDRPRATLLAQSDQGPAFRLVARLDLPGGRALILKQEQRGGPDPCDHFNRSVEAQETARLRMSGNVAGLRVPKCLARLPEKALALFECLPGATAAARIEEADDNVERRAVLQACGRWLAELHRASATGIRPYQTRYALDHQHKLRADITAGRLKVAEPGLFLRLSHQIEQGADWFERQPARHGQRHGDFGLRNVLIDRDQVAAIDFRPLQTAPVGHDVARLLVDFAALYAEHRKIPDGQLLQGPYRTAFFRGYDFARAEDASIGFLFGIQILQDWLKIPVRPEDRGLMQLVRFEGLMTTALRLFPDLRSA